MGGSCIMKIFQRIKKFATGRLCVPSDKPEKNIQRLIPMPNGYMLITKDRLSGKITAIRTDD